VTGNSNGQLTSVILPTGLNEKTTYQFNPILPSNSPVNIRLGEVAGSTNSDFETITVVVYPPEKNITVLDPGERLLIDDGTGFKRVPSVGISGNQLKFKYNPTPLGSEPFELLGIDIEGIDLTHELDATASSNATLNILVEIIDYDRNSDGSDEIDTLDDDSDNDGCSDKTESGLEDLFPAPPFTFNAGTVNARGMINLTGMAGYPSPAKDSTTGKYLFLTTDTPITILPPDQPKDDEISEGENAIFSVGTVADRYQWQMNGVDITDNATFSGSATNTLKVNTVDTSLDGEQFSVLVNSNTYLCKTPSNSATLSVLALPPIPVLNRVYSFCGTGTVADLKDLIDPAKTFNVYDEETGGAALLDTVTLINGEDYYVSAVNAAGGESVIRSFTTVVVATPNITADKNSVCFGESIHLTVNNAPQTVTEFMAANPSLDMFLEYSNSTYFYDPKVQTWNQADAFIKGLGPGATMYQINTLLEHEEVWKALMAKNHHLSGRFWIGLKQREELKGTPKKVDAGWYWLDGRVLDPSWTLWYDNPSTSFKDEPNDSPPQCDMGCAEDRDEDYGQFNFSTNMGKYLNDIGETNGNSRAIVEFQGVTQVKWYKTEPGKTREEIVGETSNSLTIEPSVTGNITYSYSFLVNGTPCGDDIVISVNPLPTPLSADPMEECDNNLDGDPNTNEASFDLAQQRKNIISKNSAVDRDIFFYETNPKALSVSDSIDTAVPYTSNPKDIYYRVVDKTTGCFGADADVDSFALIVNELPPILSIPPLSECDDTSVETDKDGLHGFDLKQKDTDVKDALIALGKDPADYMFTYHALKNDTTPITTYTTVASDAGEKEIFVRIEDNKGCIRYDNSFKVIVDKLPELKTTSITLEQCKSDGQLKYNLNSLKSEFSANYANETFEFYLDASFSPSTKVLNPENFVVPVGVSMQDVFIKIIDNNSLCARFDDVDLVHGVRKPIKVSIVVGYDAVPFSFSPEPIFKCFNLETSTTPGFEVFDPSVFTKIKDKVIASAKDEGLNYNAPNIEISFYEKEQDAIYQENKINTSIPYTNSDKDDQEIWVGIEDVGVSTITCLGRFKVADLMVRPEPVFELPEKQVYCLNLGTDVIAITNPSDSYNYSWARNGVPLSQTTQNININRGGTYTVTATNPVTECTTTKVIRVSESQIPLFDSSHIQVFDLTGDGSNRIEIDNSEAALGIGAYEFSLNDGPFQDSPIFENVPPGIHTVSVQDKNGCVGIVQQDVSVIGYPNFFTPNNDSKNDRWQLIGVSSVFQPSSFVYIFDQHGRLLAEIAADGTGWDGTYNGSPLPADDYWFRTVLEDGRVFTGNFSLVR
jgi:gliding motility-associated-like protein